MGRCEAGQTTTHGVGAACSPAATSDASKAEPELQREERCCNQIERRCIVSRRYNGGVKKLQRLSEIAGTGHVRSYDDDTESCNRCRRCWNQRFQKIRQWREKIQRLWKICWNRPCVQLRRWRRKLQPLPEMLEPAMRGAAMRSNKEFLYHILEEVIQAGATTITIADTVGSNLPVEFGKLIADIKANTPGIDNAIISTHCHNDLGLATANTLAGAYAGARQLEVTINGIGERAGNASLEEVVMALKYRPELLDGMYTGINTYHITMTSKMVQEYSGLHVQPHKAIVGANAFAHESGIHQDGMLKYKGTYEIISPDDIGLTRANDSGIVLGKLSGRHAVRSVIVELGYEISDNEFEDFFKRYKVVAEKKKRITDEDIKALLSDEIFKPKINPSVGSNNMPGVASGHVLGSPGKAHGTSTSQQQ